MNSLFSLKWHLKSRTVVCLVYRKYRPKETVRVNYFLAVIIVISRPDLLKNNRLFYTFLEKVKHSFLL
jgi:hypothetical protein